MKKFDELNSEQQERAEARCLDKMLQAVVEGAIRFNDEANGDDLQARVEAAAAKAEANHTPWFAHEYIYEAIEDELKSMARAAAEDALYAVEDDPEVIRL